LHHSIPSLKLNSKNSLTSQWENEEEEPEDSLPDPQEEADHQEEEDQQLPEE